MSRLPNEVGLYLATHVRVCVNGEWMSGFEASRKLGSPIHVVTAWNPGTVRPSPRENREANERLETELRALGAELFPAVGKDPHSEHFEESLALCSLSDEQAMEVGRRCGQIAVFRITGSRQTVLGCDGGWTVSRGSRDPIGMSAISGWINDPVNLPHLQELLDRYYGKPGIHPGFEGRQFEWFVSRSRSDCFTSEDLAAIGALSVSVPASTARKLLEDSSGILRVCLLDCHVEASQNRRSSSLGWLWRDESAFTALFNTLNREDFPGVGPVVRSKLMAVKFPEVIPIRDSRVEALLGWEHERPWWQPIHELLESTNDFLSKLTVRRDLPGVSLLRKLDVILWLEATDRDLVRKGD